MTDETPINDDELKRLLRPLDDDAAPGDDARMADAVTAATDAFRSMGPRPVEPAAKNTTRSKFMTLLAKPLAVLTAAAAVLFFAILQSPEKVAASVTLGEVLDDALSTSLELQFVKDGSESRVWVQQGSVRFEESPQQYQIAAGSRLWQVDESKDAAATTAENPWWDDEEQQVDLLAMLGAQTTRDIRKLTPVAIESYKGRHCLVYAFPSGKLFIRCRVDEKTNALDTIAAWSDPQKVKTQPPLSELRLVKRNADIDESKFVVGSGLSVDGRTGRIVDQQGIVSLRPLTHSRWTPVYGPMLIKPGDWLRTDVRGANAATVELVSKYRVIAGPGSLVELAQPQTLVLSCGEVQIIGSSAATEPVQLIGPNDQSVTIAPDETVLYRLTKQRELKRIDEKPAWLAGYEGSAAEHSIGSLIANVDGRDTPLTVGFHKVDVEIRDQIARTTIEESFVNHTDGRLEGIFHFPLPQDASISGFGMWINGELIEADVVEKQRAREIYETILRENRDPGLLEWTGGNIFKARVFPIEPHSEKRIKIVYTQVLPLRTKKFRYSYGLKSELLQKNPLRELSVNVLVNSALPLKSVTCPTHTTRIQTTEHSGRVEFSAQEYTPERDFEVVCELNTAQSDVVVIPHRRGDDGYFLAQVMPPSPEGNWQRDVLPDGRPLNLLLVCDTSGSMDTQQRDSQQQFVASVLQSLGPDDRFNLAVCDVDCEWKFEDSAAPTEESLTAVLDWLQERRSLGWTDLDAVAQSVTKRAEDNSQVIYIGDGIVTAGDADSQSFINRWKRVTASQEDTTFHAVSVGSSFESTVLKAVASVGGGSVRQVTGEQTPARVARELLNEIAQPGLRDLKVEFQGIQVAAVYPESLPNLAAGTQQIIVGRYLPRDGEQTGRMIVTGTRDGEPVRYESKIRLPGSSTVLLPANDELAHQRVRGEVFDIRLRRNGRRPDEGDSDESLRGSSSGPAEGASLGLLTNPQPGTQRPEASTFGSHIRPGKMASPLPRPGQSISERRRSRERVPEGPRSAVAGRVRANPDESQRGTSPSSVLRTFRLRRMSNTSPRSTGQNKHVSAGEKNFPVGEKYTDVSHENSFIPRLWARAHLDHLLQQGGGSFIRDEIIAMSEEFHIITPYTSLLVLETDADRERFKVTRRFLMRDGERFFADGRSSANFELVRQQMKAAGSWRLGLRLQILQALSGLGRSVPELEPVPGEYSPGRQLQLGRTLRRSSGMAGNERLEKLDLDGVGLTFDMKKGIGRQENEWAFNFHRADLYKDFGGNALGGEIDSYGNSDRLEFDGTRDMDVVDGLQVATESSALSSLRHLSDRDSDEFFAYPAGAGGAWSGKKEISDLADEATFGLPMLSSRRSKLSYVGNGQPGEAMPGSPISGFRKSRPQAPTYTNWMNQLFPPLSAPPQAPTFPETPDWSDDAIALSNSLLQTLTLPDTTGLRVQVATDSSDPVWKRQTSRNVATQLLSQQQWLSTSWMAGQHSVVSWCDENTHGVWSRSFDLGRTRKSTAEDLKSFTPGNRPFAVTPLHQTYAAYDAEIVSAEGDVVTLVLTSKNDSATTTIQIDTRKKIVLWSETTYNNGQKSSTEYSDHVEVAGAWWPQAIRTMDSKGRVTSTTTQTVEQLTSDAFTDAMRQHLPTDAVQLLSEPMPTYRAAKIALEGGSADFDDHLVLMLDAFTTQDWDEALAQLEKLQRVAEGKPGVVWIQQAVLRSARRNEESRQLLHQLADRTLDEKDSDRASAVAQFLINRLAHFGDRNEQLRLLDELKPIYDARSMGPRPVDVNHEAPTGRGPMLHDHIPLWKTHRANLLEQLGRVDEARVLRKELAESAPWDIQAQLQYAESLFNAGEHDDALAWLRQQLDRPEERQEYERYQLRDRYADLLRRDHRAVESADFLAEWLTEQPTQEAPYRMYLAALILSDRTDDADATVAHWLGFAPPSVAEVAETSGEPAARTPASPATERHSPAERARVTAAIDYATGQYHNMSSNRFDPQWLDPLLKAAQFWLPHDHHFDLVTRILNHHRFSDSDQADLLRNEIAAELPEAIGGLSLTRLGSYISWAEASQRSMSRSGSRQDFRESGGPNSGESGYGEPADFEGTTPQYWQQIASTLRTRWDAEDDHAVRRHLGDHLTSLYASHSTDSYLPFLRTRIQRERDAEEPVHVAIAVQRLFDALLSQPWSIEHEAEALSLLPQLSNDDSPAMRLAVQIQHLYRFVDTMPKLRQAAVRSALQAEGHPEELTRTELRERYTGIRKAAFEGVVASLKVAEAAEALGDAEQPVAGVAETSGETARTPASPATNPLPRTSLADWITAEQQYLNLQLDRNQITINDECWKLIERLAIAPDTIDDDTELTREQVAQLHLADQLRHRAMTVITYLAVQKSATGDMRNRLKDFIVQKVGTEDEADAAWKSQLITLLIALDEPKELEERLRAWIRADDYPVSWQLMLGRLLAEQGTLDEAITLFETVQRKQQLSPSDHSMLADWYMATDRRDDYRRARIETFKVMEEYRLQNWIGQKRQPWYRTDVPLPAELDEDVLFAFQALFEKSAHPGNYVYELQNFYTACRDFRLLKMIPDAVIGRTPQQVYSFLEGLNNNLLNELRNEATADEILERIEELRAIAVLLPRGGEGGRRSTIRRGGPDEGAEQPSDDISASTPNSQPLTRPAGTLSPVQWRVSGWTPLDLRALDLLEALIERKAAEVLNQPGPHAKQAVGALQRAYRREWAEGEIRQYVTLLAQLGTISSQPLANERLRQLRLLHDMTEPGTDDRVRLARHLAFVLIYTHNRREEGIAVQAAAIREYEQIHRDGWPSHLNDPFSEHVSLLEQVRRYAAAESLLQRHIDKPLNPSQQEWMKQRRIQVMLNALSNNGTVSLGQGRELFRNLLTHLQSEARTGTDNHRYQALNQIPQLFRIAKDRSIAFRDELRRYAFDEFPELLDTRQNNYGSLVSNLAQTIHDLMGARPAVEFLVVRMENYPQRLEVQWQNAWQQHAYQLAQWREQVAGQRNALEPRILAIVLKELRRDLTTRQQQNRIMFEVDQSYFWEQKADDFAANAEAVLRESSSVFADDSLPEERRPLTSGKRTINYVAQYLYGDQQRYDRAIEILFVAHRHKLLDVQQQINLCQWLHWRNRHAESISLLEPIVESHPDVMSYRCLLITAYHRSDRPQQRDVLLAATDEHFRRPGLWNEHNMAALATCCEENQLDEKAVAYFDEVIPLHQRAQSNRGIGGGTLSSYYQRQARAYARLGRTKEAVDAASAAVIAWGPRHPQRSGAVQELHNILRDAKDLDEFAQSVEADAEKSGLDSPLIRKAIGMALKGRSQPAAAVPHLQQSLTLQPHDLETRRALLECYDALDNPTAAVDQLLAMIDIDRYNLPLYIELAERLKDDPDLSERATTSLVEAGATEAENHQALAELRQKQNRWNDAIQHWDHVARLRSLEPTGLVNLAKAQIHEKNWSAARKSLTQLNRKEWPGRFNHVGNEIRQLQSQLP